MENQYYNQDNSKYLDGNLIELCNYLLSQEHEPNSIKIDLDLNEENNNTNNNDNIKNVFNFLLDLLLEILKVKFNIEKLNSVFEKLEQSDLEYLSNKFAAIGIKLGINIQENIYNTEYLENIEDNSILQDNLNSNQNSNTNYNLPDLEQNNILETNNNSNQRNNSLSSYFISLKYLNNNYKIFFSFL